MRLTIITPTIGRDSLRLTLASIAPQLRDGDEHLVIGDGPQPHAKTICSKFVASYHDGPASYSYGNLQRDYGISIASGEYVAFCDDDDAFTPGALDAIRAAVAECPDTPLLFRMSTPYLGVLWAEREVRMGNVGTPMIVTPRYADLPQWHDGGMSYTADHRFAKRVTDAHGVEWREEVICIVR